MGHAREADELHKVAGEELRPVVGDVARTGVRECLLFQREQNIKAVFRFL